MFITISLLILVYMIMGKDVSGLFEKVKNIDWRNMNELYLIKIQNL